MGFKKYDGSTWQSITPKKLKGIPYTGTLPATLTGTKAGYLHRYKIYGNTEQTGTPTPENPIEPSECGERTANYYNYTADTPVSNHYVNPSDGSLVSAASWSATDYVSIDSDVVILSKVGGNVPGICLYDNDKQYLNGVAYRTGGVNTKENVVIFANGAKYARFSYYTLNVNPSTLTLVSGSTAPTSYIPYGYKLPLMSAGQNVDVYIGDDTLSDAEYVDSGTGKIYRMVSGVLTPVDPPTPFPQIPTSANSTTISWAGEGLAPSEFDSIQEWVDIPTYTYTNGEWV